MVFLQFSWMVWTFTFWSSHLGLLYVVWCEVCDWFVLSMFHEEAHVYTELGVWFAPLAAVTIVRVERSGVSVVCHV